MHVRHHRPEAPKRFRGNLNAKLWQVALLELWLRRHLDGE